MKKILFVLMFLPSICFAETYYKISQKDYYELIVDISAKRTDIECFNYAPVVKTLKQEKINGMQIVIDKLERTAENELSIDEKLSILGGKITLLEMEILKLKQGK